MNNFKIYMSRNSRVFTTDLWLLLTLILIYMSRNSRVFTTLLLLVTLPITDLHE